MSVLKRWSNVNRPTKKWCDTALGQTRRLKCLRSLCNLRSRQCDVPCRKTVHRTIQKLCNCAVWVGRRRATELKHTSGLLPNARTCLPKYASLSVDVERI